MANHQQNFGRIRKNPNSNVANSDLFYSCIKYSNRKASLYTQLIFTDVRHTKKSPSAPEIKSTGPTLLRGKEKGISSRLPENLTKFLPQHGRHKQNENTLQTQENMFNKKDANIFQADEIIALQVVTEEYQRGLYQFIFQLYFRCQELFAWRSSEYSWYSKKT